MQVETNQVQRNSYIIYQSEPHLVVDREFVNPGKGVAFTRFRLRSLRTGNVVTTTIKSGDLVEVYEVFSKDMQLLYQDGDQYVFMDPETYDQTPISADLLGSIREFLKEGETYRVLLHETEGVGVQLPRRVVLTVVEAPPVVRGDTANTLTKVVTLENGITVSVPAFIEAGDQIAVDPETRQYIERIKS